MSIKILDKLSKDIDFIRCNVEYIKDYISREGIPIEKPTNFKDLLRLMNSRKEEYTKESGIWGYIDTPIKDLDDLKELRNILTHAINSIEKGDDNG